MIGVVLTLIGGLFSEVATSIGKRSVAEHRESMYTMGFLHMFWGALIFSILAFRDASSFTFALASLPTFIPRVVLELLQAHMALLAVVRADRSTFGFLRILTIPFLLIADTVIGRVFGTAGYELSEMDIVGIGAIIAALFILFINHGIRKDGSLLVLFTALNAVATISLYKYDITVQGNSVVAEQMIVTLILMAYFATMALRIARENPIGFLKRPRFLAESVSEGIGHVLLSFAFIFAPPSVITTAKRSTEVLWSVTSGSIYFHETHVVAKIVAFLLVVMGLLLVAF